MNGDKSDNRIENLELWTNDHPRGQRVEDKLRWAREFIAFYDSGVTRSEVAYAGDVLSDLARGQRAADGIPDS